MNRAAPRSVTAPLLRLALLLSTALPGVLVVTSGGTLTGCAKDHCLAADLPPQQLCTCKPKDDDVLARLSSTELPYPVRSAVQRCVDDIHRSDPRNIVTKQSLRDCIKGTSLDAPTQASLDQAIQRSNLMEQTKLDNWHAQCLGGQAPAAAPVPGAPPSAAPAASPTPAPAATPAAAPAASPATTGASRPR